MDPYEGLMQLVDAQNESFKQGREERGLLSGIGAGLGRGAYGVYNAGIGLTNFMSPGIGEMAVEGFHGQTPLETPEFLRPSPSVEKKIFDWSNPKWYVERVPELVPQIAAQVGIAMFTGGAGNVASKFGAVGGAMSLGSVRNEAYERLLKDGKSKEEAASIANAEGAIVGTVTAALDKIVGGQLLKNSKAGQRHLMQRIQKVLKTGGLESLTESAQELSEDTVRWIIENDEDAFDNAMQRYLAAAALGGIAGGGMDVAVEVPARQQRLKQLQEGRRMTEEAKEGFMKDVESYAELINVMHPEAAKAATALEGEGISRTEWKDTGLGTALSGLKLDAKERATLKQSLRAIQERAIPLEAEVQPDEIISPPAEEDVAVLEPVESEPILEPEPAIEPVKKKPLARRRGRLSHVDLKIQEEVGEDLRDQATFRNALDTAYNELKQERGAEESALQSAKKYLWGDDSRNKAKWRSRQNRIAKWLGEGRDSDYILSKLNTDEQQLIEVLNSEAPGRFHDVDEVMDMLATDTHQLQMTDSAVFERAWHMLGGWEPGRADEAEADIESQIQDTDDVPFEEFVDPSLPKAPKTVQQYQSSLQEESLVPDEALETYSKSPLRRGQAFGDLSSSKSLESDIRAAQSPAQPKSGIPRAQAVPLGDKTRQISEHSIIRTMEHLFKTRFNLDRMSRQKPGVRGYYKILEDYIRIRGKHIGSLAIESHELAHKIDKRYGLADALLELTSSDPERAVRIMRELEGMDYKPEAQRWREGWAEWYRYYTTGMEDPAQAPNLLEWFTNDFAAKSDLLEKSNRIRDLVKQWRDQGTEKRISANILNENEYPDAILEPGEKAGRYVLNKAEEIYTNWTDELYPLSKFAKMAKEEGYEGFSAYELALANAGSSPAHAERALYDGVRDIKTGKELSEGLFEYKKHLEDKEYEEWRNYIVSVFALEVWDKGVMDQETNPGIEKEEANAMVEKIAADPQKQARYDKAHKVVTDFNNALFEMLVKIPGMKTEADFLRAKAKWELYIPMMRVTKDKNTLADRLAGATHLNIKSPVFSRKPGGSGLPLQDPIISTIQRALSFHSHALKSEVKWQMLLSSVPALGGAENMGGMVEWDVDPNKTRQNFNVKEAIKQLVDGGFMPEEHAKVLRGAHYIRSGVEYGFPTIKLLAKHFGLEVPNIAWDDMKPSQWKQIPEQDQDFIIETIESRVDEIPDIMQQIAIYKPEFVASHGEYIEVVYREGKAHLVRWDPQIYNTLDGMDNYQAAIFTQVFRSMNRLKKLGTIGLNTAFSGANFFRDFWTFLHQTKFSKGFIDSATNPLYWISRDIAYLLSKTPIFKKVFKGKDTETIELWEEMSGNLATRLGADKDSIARIHARVKNTKLRDKVKYSIMHPLQSANNVTDFLREWIGITEVGFRLAEFERALNHSKYERKFDSASGKMRIWSVERKRFERPDRRSLVRAINAANDVTTNFKRRGKKGKVIDAYVTFSNASIQGQDKQIRTIMEAFAKHASGTNPLSEKMKKKLGARLIVMSIASAAATAAYWFHRKDDDDYKAAPDWLNFGYWTFAPNGKPIARIPRDHSWNVIPIMTEAMLNDLDKDGRKDQSKKALVHIAEKRNPLGSPIDEGLFSFFGGTEVPIVKPTIESLMNYDFFRKSPIEGPRPLKTEDRYTAHTTWMSKQIGKSETGKKLGISPAKADHWLNSASGGFYRDLFRDPLKGLTIKRDYTPDVQDFYSKKSELEEEYGSAVKNKKDVTDIKTKKAMLNAYADLMTELRRPIKEVRDRDERFEREKYIIGLARHALGRPPLDRYPSPFKKGVKLPAEVKETVDAELGNWIWTATGASDSESRANARAKLNDLGVSRERARSLIMKHGILQYQESRKKNPLKKTQKPASMGVRTSRVRRLTFLKGH